jgi:hypothetical protein
MTKEAKIVGLAALAAIAFFAFNSIKAEYARIQSRVEVTQAKVDALADELARTTGAVHAAIKSLTDRFLANAAGSVDIDISTKTQDKASVDNEKTVVRSTDVNSLPERTSSVPTILMHTTDNCGPCKAWVKNDSERWRNSGWEVVVLPPETGHPFGYPWFEITDRDGKQFEVNGPLTNNNFNAARAGAK